MVTESNRHQPFQGVTGGGTSLCDSEISMDIMETGEEETIQQAIKPELSQ